MKKFSLLPAIIKESLRLYPPVPFIARQIQKPSNIYGYEFDRYQDIIINIWDIHHSKEYWGVDVDMFKPERFLYNDILQFSFIPFSAGSRNCIGQKFAMNEMIVFLAYYPQKK